MNNYQIIGVIDCILMTERWVFQLYKAGCEHVWNTHVVPLQDKLIGIDNFIDTCTDEYKREYGKLESENKALRDEVERLKINQPPFR